MDILNSILGLTDKIGQIKDSLDKDAIKKKHDVRRRFYTLLLDYINGPGAASPNNFFSWYSERLDERMRMSPQWLSGYYRLSRTKNESGFRQFLDDCDRRSQSESKFTEIIKAWIPDDEHRIIASTSSSDITEVVEMAIGMCEEKDRTQKQIRANVIGNMPLLGMGFMLHWVIFSFIYQGFVTPGFQESTLWNDMSLVEQNYVRYVWITNNYLYVIGVIIAITVGFSWSIKNWHQRGVFIREHYLDYLPPYSLAKVNEQYSILIIISSFMRSGKSFSESLMQVRNGASKYVQYQVDKILDNDTEKASVAINTFYLGNFGSDVRERAGYIPMDQAIATLLPRMQLEKQEKFDRIIKITLSLSFKPIMYISLGYAIVPVFITIFDSLPTN
jgi:hypothetical protein